jgi:hypothetical protein
MHNTAFQTMWGRDPRIEGMRVRRREFMTLVIGNVPTLFTPGACSHKPHPQGRRRASVIQLIRFMPLRIIV